MNTLRMSVAALVCLIAGGCSASAPAGTNPPSAGSAATATPSATASLPPRPTHSPTPEPTQNPLAGRLEAEISVPGGPDFPVQAFDALWVLAPDSDEPSVTRLDPTTNEVVATIPVGTRLCQAIGASPDAIWACGKDGLVRIDPATNEVLGTIEFPTAQFFGYLPFGAGSLWAPSGEVTLTDELVRIDPVTNAITDTIPLGFDAEWISFGEDAIWLTDTKAGILWKLDPDTHNLTEHATGLTDPSVSAVGAGSIWLAVNATREGAPDPADTTVVRIDHATGAVQAEIATGGTMFEGMLYADDETVWARSSRLFLAQIDPTTNEVVDRIDSNQAGGSVIVAFDSLWATALEFGRVFRLSR